jgi:uncharacterized cysteine cluster protein YcgN (CxxCxxCC family)
MSEPAPDPVRPDFWRDLPLDALNRTEWELLCDGCGKCCLNKLEDEDTGHVALTRVACRLLDGESCRCSRYATRHDFVPECIVLTPQTLARNLYWLPRTCAYRLRAEGRALCDWHPLVSGDAESVHRAGMSVRGITLPETAVDEDDWEDLIIEEPGT